MKKLSIKIMVILLTEILFIPNLYAEASDDLVAYYSLSGNTECGGVI